MHPGTGTINLGFQKKIISMLIRLQHMKICSTFLVSSIFTLIVITYHCLIFISGGYPRDRKSVNVGRMTDLGLEWTKGPELLVGRYAHRSILIGNQIYHIGGSGNL